MWGEKGRTSGEALSLMDFQFRKTWVCGGPWRWLGGGWWGTKGQKGEPQKQVYDINACQTDINSKTDSVTSDPYS